MKTIVTGAAGFIGQALVRQLLQQDERELTLLDRDFSLTTFAENENITCIAGELQDSAVRAQLLNRDFDVLFHLAAVPGGAAEADPALSRRVNLDTTLALFEEAAVAAKMPRIVYTSTIAVLGAPLPAQVDDSCPIIPAMTYGTHKAMMELALADMSRRGLLDSVAVRLPGVVARPHVASGLKSAFMSNVFHSLRAGERFISPVSRDATMWLMSVQQCAASLLHAAEIESSVMPLSRVVTLPAVHCSMGELVDAIASEAGQTADLVSYQPDANLELNFGSYPPLVTPAADAAGYRGDGTLQQLVRNVYLDLH